MRLVRAELLKLRRRRGLVAAGAVVTILPVVVAFTVVTILHSLDPAKYDGAGGAGGLDSSLLLLMQFGSIAAVLVGATAGAGDRGAGVFRELVATGRSRAQLFAARIPGGLAFLLPLVAVGFVVATTASVASTDDGQPPVTAVAVAEYGVWIAAAVMATYVLALGFSSALGSRGTSIAILLAWQLAAAPILLATGKLDNLLPNAALAALNPSDDAQFVSTSATAAAVILVVWALVPLAAGAWRTRTVDA